MGETKHRAPSCGGEGVERRRLHLDRKEPRSPLNGKLCYLWRAVDHEGEVLESVVTAKRDKAAAVKFLKLRQWPRQGRGARGDDGRELVHDADLAAARASTIRDR